MSADILIIIAVIVFIGGILLILWAMKDMGSWVNEEKGFTLKLVLAGICLSSALILGTYSNQLGKKELTNQIAIKLKASPQDIIIEELNESSNLFSNSTNQNLRRIHHKGMTYIAEVDGSDLLKISEEKN